MEDTLSDLQSYLEAKKLSPASIKNYVSDVRKFLEWKQTRHPEATNNPLSFITPPIINNYKAHLTQTNTPSKTMNRHFSSLRTLGDFLQKEKLMMANPAQHLENIPQKQVIKENPLLDTRQRLYEIGEKHDQTFWLVIVILIITALLLGLGLFFYLKLTKKSSQPQIFLQQTTGNAGLSSTQTDGKIVDISCQSCLDSRTLQGFTPSASASAGKIPVLSDAGELVLAGKNPTLYSTRGVFGIKSQEMSLSTDIGTNGNITLQPDGTGAVFFHLGGDNGDQLKITNANISSGTLLSAYAGNSNIGFDLLRLSSGVAEIPRFRISSAGDLSLSRNASIAGNLDTTAINVKGWLEKLLTIKNNSGAEIFSVKNNDQVILSQYLTHSNDEDTFLNFEDDSLKIEVGGAKYFKFTENTTDPDTLTGNWDKKDVDFMWHSVNSPDTNPALMVDASSSNVGIGTVNPNFRLEVQGNSYFGGNITTTGNFLPNIVNSSDLGSTSTEWKTLYLGDDAGLYFGNDQDAHLYYDEATDNRLELTGTSFDLSLTGNLSVSSGSVGIGTTSPARALQVNGSIRMGSLIAGAGGAAAVYRDVNGDLADATSSLRFKHQITDYGSILEKVLALRPVNFLWNENTSTPNAPDFGLIAEEVEKILPELTFYEADGQTVRGVKYEKLGVVLINAIKEQQILINNLETKIIKLAAGVFQSITTEKLISPLVEADNLYAQVIYTDLLKPMPDKDLIIQMQNANIKMQNSKGEDVFTVDSKGNTTTSGILTTQALQTQTATISGILSAQTVYTEDLQARSGHFKTLTADQFYYPQASSSADMNNDILADLENKVASLSSSLTNNLELNIPKEQYLSLESLDVNSAIFNEFLAVLGQAIITNLRVTNNFSVDNSLVITNNSIAMVGCPNSSTSEVSLGCNKLYLQPSGLGGINMLAGKVTINENGDVYISGNLDVAGKIKGNDLTVAKNATVSGDLFANFLKPTNDLEIQLNQLPDNASQSAKLLIEDANDNLMASIDASGSATFNKLNIAQASGVNNLGFGEMISGVTTNAAAGQAILPRLFSEINLYNQNITKDSLIYITPTGSTNNNVLYVKTKYATANSSDPGSILDGYPPAGGSYFTVAVDKPINKDIEFNWWIIN